MENNREKIFKRNKDLEILLKDINFLFSRIEKSVLPKFKKPKYPIIFIQGVGRSGTTLLMQWLANSGCFSYPTNFLSRFYGAPYIGAKIQQLIFDKKYNFNNELYNFTEKIEYSSNLGKTKGALAPNEFWYFWRRFFKFDEIQILSKEQEKEVDKDTFISEIAAIEEVFKKPFVMKGMIVNWNLPFISKISDNIFFIHIKREPIYNIRSLLSARKKYFGNEEIWYSFKPPEYKILESLSPEEQVAGQIFFTNKAISEGLGKINQKRWIEIDYELFCEQPEMIFNKIKEMLIGSGYQFDHSYNGVERFNDRNKAELLERKGDLFEKSFNKFESGEF